MDLNDLTAKAKDVLPDDETIEKVSDKVQEHTPDQVDGLVGKAEEWAKDHNKD